MKLPYENGSSRPTYSDQRRQGIYRLLLFKYGVLNNNNEVKKNSGTAPIIVACYHHSSSYYGRRQGLRVGDPQQQLVSVVFK